MSTMNVQWHLQVERLPDGWAVTIRSGKGGKVIAVPSRGHSRKATAEARLPCCRESFGAGLKSMASLITCTALHTSVH